MLSSLAKALAFSAVILAGCGSSPDAFDSPPAAPSVIFVVADTLRRDHVGAYNRDASATPFLDSLASRAVVFERAFTQCPWTAPSVASMFTSRYQSEHRIIAFGSTLAPEEITLAEVLSGKGYATAGFSANVLLQEGWGFAQGFDTFLTIGSKFGDSFVKGTAAAVNEAALGWLDSRQDDQRPVFLYLHYMEPHIPYNPSEEQLAKAFGNGPRPDLDQVNSRLLHHYEELTPDEVDTAKLVYRLMVADLDRELGQLFAALDKRGVLGNSVFVFTADHGEEMVEHGSWGHGMSLFDPGLAVPLLMGSSSQSGRRDVAEDVALVDVAPTLLDLLRIPAPATFEGRSLVPLRSRQTESGLVRFAGLLPGWGRSPVPVVSELLPAAGVGRPTDHQRAVRVGARKLIRSGAGGNAYYQLDADPDESAPIRSFDQVPLSLVDALDDFVRRMGAAPAPAPAPQVDAPTKEKMRALGYAQ